MADNKENRKDGAKGNARDRGDAKDNAKGRGAAKDSARDGAEFKPVDLREVKALLRRIDDKLGGASLLGDAPSAPYRRAAQPYEALEQLRRLPLYGQSLERGEWGSPDDPSVLNDYDD